MFLPNSSSLESSLELESSMTRLARDFSTNSLDFFTFVAATLNLLSNFESPFNFSLGLASNGFFFPFPFDAGLKPPLPFRGLGVGLVLELLDKDSSSGTLSNRTPGGLGGFKFSAILNSIFFQSDFLNSQMSTESSLQDCM